MILGLKYKRARRPVLNTGYCFLPHFFDRMEAFPELLICPGRYDQIADPFGVRQFRLLLAGGRVAI